MAITEKQKQDRIRGIGSSEIGALLGCSPYASAHDVWLEKTGRADGFEGNERTRRGEIMEPAIMKLAELEIGQRIVAPKGPFVKGVLRSNIDGMIDKYAKGQPIVEAKSTFVLDGWGEPGTDQVPEHVLLQVMHQLHCAESDFAYVVRLGAFFKLDVYEVEYDRDLGEMIERMAGEFWRNHVEADTPPEIEQGTDTTLGYYGSIMRDKEAAAPVASDDCYEYVVASRDVKEAEKRKAKAKARILMQLGDAGRGEVGGYRVKVATMKGRSTVDGKRLRQDHPEIYDQYVKHGSPFSRCTIEPE